MLSRYLKARLTGIRVTEVRVEGAPGLALDTELLAAAKIMPGERIRVVVHGGAEFECYASPARRGSGTVSLSGRPDVPPHATLTVTTECLLVEREALTHEPREVVVGDGNRPVA